MFIPLRTIYRQTEPLRCQSDLSWTRRYRWNRLDLLHFPQSLSLSKLRLEFLLSLLYKEEAIDNVLINWVFFLCRTFWWFSNDCGFRRSRRLMRSALLLGFRFLIRTCKKSLKLLRCRFHAWSTLAFLWQLRNINLAPWSGWGWARARPLRWVLFVIWLLNSSKNAWDLVFEYLLLLCWCHWALGYHCRETWRSLIMNTAAAGQAACLLLVVWD